MRKTALAIATLAMSWVVLDASPSLATNAHSYIASNGSGTTCSITAPCADLGTAVAATQSAGEVSCLDGGTNFVSTATITQSVTIDCAGVPGAFFGIIINGNNIVVTLRNMSFGLGGNNTGIDFQNGAALFVENSVVDNINSGLGIGINFEPSTGTAKLFVTDSVIKNNHSVVGCGAGKGEAISCGTPVGAGIAIQPGSGAAADITIERTKVENNYAGITAIGAVGAVHGVVRDSVLTSNTTWGLDANGFQVALLMENTTVSGNQYGILAQNSAALMVAHSSIVLNTTGLYTGNGGSLITFKNNNVLRNTTNGSFTNTAVTQQ